MSGRKPGRPSAYTKKLAETICSRLIEGESLRQICSDDAMPHRTTVMRWQGDNPDFATKCARARESQSDLMDDLILDTAKACVPETAQADKVKISAFQWRAAKLAPKKYGDRLALTGADGGAVKLETVHELTDEQLAAIASAGSSRTAAAPEGESKPARLRKRRSNPGKAG